MIERIAEMPAGTIGFRFSGEITRARLRRCFEGYDAGAVWEDLKMGAKFGPGHFSAWKRVAFVTGVEWVRHLAALFGWMTPGEMKLYPLGELEAAKTWVAG
jgi:hypothetical protein